MKQRRINHPSRGNGTQKGRKTAKGDRCTQQAKAAFQQGDYEEAVRLDTQAGRAYLKDGKPLWAGQRYQHAAIVCGANLSDHEGQVKYGVKSADAFMCAKDYPAAAREYASAAAVIVRDFPNSRENIAESAILTVKAGEVNVQARRFNDAGNNFRIASVRYEQELKDFPQAVEMAARAGECFTQGGAKEDAETSFTKAEYIAENILHDEDLVRKVQQRRVQATR